MSPSPSAAPSGGASLQPSPIVTPSSTPSASSASAPSSSSGGFVFTPGIWAGIAAAAFVVAALLVAAIIVCVCCCRKREKAAAAARAYAAQTAGGAGAAAAPTAGGAVVDLDDFSFNGFAAGPPSPRRSYAYDQEQQQPQAARGSDAFAPAPFPSPPHGRYSAASRADLDFGDSYAEDAALPGQAAMGMERARVASVRLDSPERRPLPPPAAHEGARRSSTQPSPRTLPRKSSAGSALLRPPSQPQLVGGRRTPRGSSAVLSPAAAAAREEQLTAPRRKSGLVPAEMRRVSSQGSGLRRPASATTMVLVDLSPPQPRPVALAAPWLDSSDPQGRGSPVQQPYAQHHPSSARSRPGSAAAAYLDPY